MHIAGEEYCSASLSQDWRRDTLATVWCYGAATGYFSSHERFCFFSRADNLLYRSRDANQCTSHLGAGKPLISSSTRTMAWDELSMMQAYLM
jgi:hypothetical protein